MARKGLTIIALRYLCGCRNNMYGVEACLGGRFTQRNSCIIEHVMALYKDWFGLRTAIEPLHYVKRDC